MKLVHRLLIVSLAVFLGLIAGSSAPAAADDGISASVSTFVSANMGMIAFGTVVAFGAAAFVPSLGQKTRSYLVVGGILGAGAILWGMTASSTRVIEGVEPPPGVTWISRIATTYDTDADADTKVLDSEGYTSCDAGTPDLNGEIPVLATNGIVDESKATLALQSDSDDDVARNAVGFQEIDCPLFAFSVALSGTVDVDGNGVDDSVTWKAKLQSMGPATFKDANATTQPVLFYDSDAGWECAFLTEGNIWVSAFDDVAKYQLSGAPSSGPWRALGSHAGAGAAFDTGTFACVFNTPDGAPTGYTVPPSAGNVEWSATILVGSETNNRAYTVNWVLFTRA